jgi:hypothetical protein
VALPVAEAVSGFATYMLAVVVIVAYTVSLIAAATSTPYENRNCSPIEITSSALADSQFCCPGVPEVLGITKYFGCVVAIVILKRLSM